MADYIDSEAEESDEGAEVQDDDDDDDQIGVVRKPKSRIKVKRRDDEDEEEEDDDEMLAEEMKDLIDDNEVEEEESDDDSVIGKRKRRDDEEEEDELDDRLEDDDYDLIEENLGVKVQRKKFRRLQQLEDDESDEDENRDNGLSADDREVIANELFEGEDEEGARSIHSRLREIEEDGLAPEMPSEGEEEEYSDPDDFIVDDDGRPLTKNRRRRPRFTDASLQQAQDIFGVDIDFNDFDAYGDDEEVDDDLDYEEELEADRRKTKKPPPKKTTRKSIFEVYEPSELERGHFTDKDNEIRVTDIPERFQLRGIPVTPVEDSELLEEAEWIYKYAFNTPTVSNQEEDVKAALAEHAVAKGDKWAEMKNQTANAAAAAGAVTPAATASGEDWDNEIAEDWDAECKTGSLTAAAPPMPKVPEEEDWDAEIASDAASAAPPVATAKKFDDNVPCGEDWDDDIDSTPAEKMPAGTTKAVDDNIEASENWDDDPAPASAAKDTAFNDMIGGDEDWDAEETGGATGKADPSQPPVKKGPSAAEIAANAEADKKRITMVKKIKEVLNFMRNHHFEVPFIAFYRKEYVEPELNINDLWRIYSWDEKWCQLSIRKANLLRLFQKMHQFQCDEIMSDPDKPLPDDLRVLADEDLDRLKAIQTFEELKDAYSHFVLYYGQDTPKMQEALNRKALEERREKRAQRNKGGSGDDGLNMDVDEVEEDEDEIPLPEDKIKQATRVDAYTFCRRAGLASLAKKFGLTPLQFGENLRDNYQRNEVEQYPMKPLEVAQEYVCKNFPSADDVLKGVRYMVAAQLAREPLIRQCVREMFFERAKVNVSTNKKGVKEIDESHPCYPMKYLRNKPVKDLKNAAFLKLVIAEEDGLLTVKIGMDLEGKGLTGAALAYADEIKQLYHRDEFSDVVQEWNKQRALVLELALDKFLYPVLQKELRQRLLQEAREHITKACCRRLYGWLKMGPYVPDQPMDDDEDFDTANGIRVLAIAYLPDWDTAAFGALVDGEGEMTDFVRLPHLLKRKNAYKEADRIAKENDLENLRKFVLDKKPHVIGVGGESREALYVVEDVKSVIAELVDSDQIPQIGVELIDNDLAKVYMNSTKAEADFREYPPLLKQAISLARRLQDPLIEFSQLCNAEEEIMCLRYHPLQDQVPKDDLINALQLEFVNRTNEVGVDVNRAIANPHTANLVQFVCGLGPRKGQALLKILKQTNSRLENRTNLVMAYHMGPKVFINCAGFIKIDTNSMGDSTDAYVEVLDGSRVHPETYDWARKMAVDALEYDDMAEDANPAGALEEILENPEKLKDLDLDAFAEELERQGFGNRSITLYDIRAELNHRYKDLRARHRPPTAEERFNMLTKETAETFYVGKLVLCRAVGIARRKPQGEQLDQANPVRNDDTGLWQCPFCLKNDFLEVSEVWNHFDAGSCPGQATGVRTRLDNGVFGFVPTKFISDKHVTSPEERIQIGMTIHCRIVKIDIERLQADLTCRSSDLADKNHDWRPTRDVYYDAESDERDCKTDEDAKKRQARQAYIKRVIVHPSFHNIGFKEAEKLLDSMDQGDVVVRPSSKGSDHLTVTWKVADGIYQHIDVREEGKENAFSLGQSLWIGEEEYEDLDEIIARYVQPMAAHVRDLLAFRYYRDTGGGKREAMDKLLMEEKRKTPSKIHYLLSASKEYPGKFVLSYLPRNKARHEYVTASPEGLRYRQQMFHSVNHLIRWFKEHFRDPVPGTPSSQTGRTPAGGANVAGHTTNPYRAGMASATATPSINLAAVDAQAIQRAAKNMPHQLFNTLTQVASQTPVAGHTTPYASRFGGFQPPPYTPSHPMATPMMTPSYHHHQQQQHHHPVQQPPPPVHHHHQQHPLATASHHGMMTPRYHHAVATPVPWHHPSQTPSSGRTPNVSSSSSRNQPPSLAAHNPKLPRQHKQPNTSSASKGSGSTSASSTTDWKKAAELWAKKQQQMHHGGGGGGGQTPKTVEPSGDATPLIDEWPA